MTRKEKMGALHYYAMVTVEEADTMADRHKARAAYRRAAALEEKAALLAERGWAEHAILARSAAWMWIDGHRPLRAIRVAVEALMCREVYEEPDRASAQLREVMQAARGIR